MQPELLRTLVCPVTRSPLKTIDPAALERLNRAISHGDVRNLGGKLVEKAIEAGLVRDDGALMYPIVDHIPLLLPEEGIRLIPS